MYCILFTAVLIIASVVFRAAIKEPLPEPEQPTHEGEDESIWDNTLNQN